LPGDALPLFAASVLNLGATYSAREERPRRENRFAQRGTKALSASRIVGSTDIIGLGRSAFSGRVGFLFWDIRKT